MFASKRFYSLQIIVILALLTSIIGVQGQDTVTLRVWDTFTEASDNAGMEKMIAAFEAANPTVKIERDTMRADDMRPILRTSLASGTGPDVMYYDTGPGFAGVLAEAGLLMPLDDAYTSKGWDDQLFQWTKARTTFGDKVYGIGNELEFLGVYYNMDIFDELGLEIPTTYEEFLTVCATVKEAGYIPVAFADAGKWPAYHMFSIFTNNIAGKDKMDSLLFGDGSWDDPDVIEAIKLFFVDMNQAGYLTPSTNAVSYDDGNGLYFNGQAAMHMTGSWLIGQILDNTTFPTGFFFFPSIDGKQILPPAGLGSGYFVSSATEHPEEAVAYLDFLFDPTNAGIWMEDMSKIPPYPVDTENFNLSPLVKFAIDALATTEMGYNIDVVTPDTFNTMMGDGFQAVLAGEKTPEQQAADLQTAMDEFRKEQKSS
ncbi:MAG: extracellular solute-binding protein [Anaerolineae bacterium]|nr:extracellular solute-binding protein [Anaerolineae bacterium]